MRKKLAYAILVLGLLGVVAANHSLSKGSTSAVRTADIMPWPPH